MSIPVLALVAATLLLTYPQYCNNIPQAPPACIPTPSIPCPSSVPSAQWRCQAVVGPSVVLAGQESTNPTTRAITQTEPSIFIKLEPVLGFLLIAALLGIAASYLWRRLRPPTETK
jgi:hypothetical protein